MGYYLQAFIGRKDALLKIQSSYSQAKLQELGQDLYLIPVTEELFDQINNLTTSENISSFEYLTENVESEILRRVANGTVAYIEAEYFGGKGGQIGTIWKDGARHLHLSYSQTAINKVLSFFGIVADTGKDEFDTLDFGRHRNTRDWIDV